MSLIGRYVFRETLQTWLVVTLVLLVILVTNQFASVVGDAASNKLPRDAILELIGLTSIQYLTILVPVSLFLSIMLSLARLYHDSEMAALMACGFGPARLYRPLLALGVLLALAVGVLAMAIAPAAVRQIGDMAAEARREASLGLLEAGRFVTLGDTGAVLYAGEVNEEGRLRDVFVQRRTPAGTVEVVVAAEAWQVDAGADGLRVLVFADGRRYEGEPGEGRFRVMAFAEHGIPFSLPPAGSGSAEPEARSTAGLLGSDDAADRAELHWRLSVPLTLLVLVVLAVPLARTEPRKGRFTGVAPAVLVYVIYANLLAAGRGWLEREQVPGWLGLWWVHALFLLAAAAMLGWQQGWLQGLRRRRAPPVAAGPA